MDTRIWHKVGEKQGVVLSLTGDTLYRIDFNGKEVRREAAEVVNALSAGQDPASLVSAHVKAVPLSAIRRVEVSHGRDTVRFVTIEGDKPVKVEFSVQSGDDAPGIARAVVERAAIDPAERTEDISVVEALIGPVILGVIVGVLWALVYGVATGIDAGDEINVNQGGRRGRGLKRLIAFIAEMLGTNGTIAVGVILLAAFVSWAIFLIVKRPQRLVWGPTSV